MLCPESGRGSRIISVKITVVVTKGDIFITFKNVRRIYEYFCPFINLYLHVFLHKVTIFGIMLILFLGCCTVWMWAMLLKFERHFLAPCSGLPISTSCNNPRTELTLSITHRQRKTLLKAGLFEKRVLKEPFVLRRHEMAKELRKLRTLSLVIWNICQILGLLNPEKIDEWKI